MARLGSTWFDGFIGSAKYTGQKLANRLGKVIPEMVSSFVSGWDGQGWKLFRSNAEKEEYTLEIDNLTVRKSMRVYELVIQKIRAVCGALGISQACGQVAAVIEDDDYYYIAIEGDATSGYGGFMAHDLVRCQRWTTSGLNGYWVEVESVDEATGILSIPKTEFYGTICEQGDTYDADQVMTNTPTQMGLPAVGDDLVQYGNTENAARRTAIYLHADENAQPAMDILFGISSRSFVGCLKVRLGGGLPGSGDVGLYCKDGHILAQSSDGGKTLYEFKPSGDFTLGNGKITYDAATDTLNIESSVKIEWTAPAPIAAVTYALSTSGTEQPSENAWSTDVPTLEKGKYLWTRTHYTYTDGTDSGYSYSVTYIGTDGEGISYILIPDVGSIVYDPNTETFTPSSVSIVTALKIVGTTQTNMLGSVYCTVHTSGTTFSLTTKTSTFAPDNAGYTRCDFTIKEGGEEKAKVSIPIITDGANGESVRKNLLNRTDLVFDESEYLGTVLDDGNDMSNYRNYTLLEGQGVGGSDMMVMEGTADAEVNAAQWDVTDELKGGCWYVLSFYVRGSGTMQTFVYPNTNTNQYNYSDGERNAASSDVNHTWTLTSEWVRHYHAFFVPMSISGSKYVLFRIPQGAANTASVCLVRLEKKATLTAYGYYQLVRGYIADSDYSVVLDNATIEEGGGVDGTNCVMTQGAQQWPQTNIFYTKIQSVLMPDTIYTLSFYVKSDYAMETNIQSVLATDFTPLADGAGTSGTTAGQHTWPSTSGEWVRHTYTFKTASEIPATVWLYFRRECASGSKGTYVRICQMKLERGAKATDWNVTDSDMTLKLPTWVKEWSGHSTKIGSTYVVTPQAFFGEKEDDGTLTGILMGNRAATIDGVTKTGLFALANNDVRVAIDPVNKQYKFRGTIIADEGQFFGMTYGSVFKSSAEVTADNFWTYFQKRTIGTGDDAEEVVVPNYYQFPTIVVFKSVPSDIEEQGYVDFYLPPFYYGSSTPKITTEEDYALALSLLGTTFVVFDKMATTLIRMNGLFLKEGDAEPTLYRTSKLSTNVGGARYFTLRVTSKGKFVWEYKDFTEDESVPFNGLQPMNPGGLQIGDPGSLTTASAEDETETE